MRRVAGTVILVGLSVALTAQTALASCPGQDSVRGTAKHQGADPPYPTIEVHIDAFSDADGTHPGGHLSLRGESPIVPYRGRVTCLSVVGNRATVGIEIIQSDDPSMIGKGELWNVVDGATDRIAGGPLTPTPPMACPPLTFSVPVVAGGYTIRDA